MEIFFIKKEEAYLILNIISLWTRLSLFLTLDKMGGGQVDGISLLPALQNPTESWPSRTLYWEHNRQWQAMLHENWKLLRKNQKSAWELYNLAEDPAEERDLASENPLKVKELSELLFQQRVESKLHPLKKST